MAKLNSIIEFCKIFELKLRNDHQKISYDAVDDKFFLDYDTKIDV